jgi:hypothetical protein
MGSKKITQTETHDKRQEYSFMTPSYIALIRMQAAATQPKKVEIAERLQVRFCQANCCGRALGSFDCRPFDECEDVRIDHVGIRGHHSVWQSRINFERAMLEQADLQH